MRQGVNEGAASAMHDTDERAEISPTRGQCPNKRRELVSGDRERGVASPSVTPAEVSPSEQAGGATVMSVYDEVTEVSEAHGGKPLGTFIH